MVSNAKKKNSYLCSRFHSVRNYTELQLAFWNPFKNENISRKYYYNLEIFPGCSQCYFSLSVNEGSLSIYSTSRPLHQLDTYVFTRQNDNILELLWILSTFLLVSSHKNEEYE